MVTPTGNKTTTHRRKASKTAPLQTYIKRVAKTAAPNLSLSSASLRIVNSFVMHFFDKMAVEATSLMRNTGRQTLTSRDMQGAVRLIFHEQELGRYAMSEGVRAVGKLSSGKN